MRYVAATFASALLLAGCGSAEPAPPPPPPAPLVTGASPAPAAGPAGRKRDQVLFSVKNADLAREVLPLFQEQVGVSIAWFGEARPVTLRLAQPMDWEQALSLVCQFTRTHATRDYKGALVLKDGWGGDLGDGDLRALEEKGNAGGARQGGQRAPAWNDGSGRPGAPGGSGIPQPTGAYSGGEEANRILKGASTRTSPR